MAVRNDVNLELNSIPWNQGTESKLGACPSAGLIPGYRQSKDYASLTSANFFWFVQTAV